MLHPFISIFVNFCLKLKHSELAIELSKSKDSKTVEYFFTQLLISQLLHRCHHVYNAKTDLSQTIKV